MDDAENWKLNSHTGTDMYQVTWPSTCITNLQTMVHELGHSLGLSHSKERSAIMAPFHKVPAGLIHPWAISENNFLRTSH